jgi:hypothetical protein
LLKWRALEIYLNGSIINVKIKSYSGVVFKVSVCKEIFKAIFCYINSSARMHESNIINLLVSFPPFVGIWNEFASLELSSRVYCWNLHGIQIHVRIFKFNVLTADIFNSLILLHNSLFMEELERSSLQD